MRLFLAAAIVLLSAELCSGYRHNDDEIKSLPGVSFEVNFKQYSGFLNASSTRFVHYWFVESQSNASHDPLLIWLASPGFSTLSELLKGFGPFHVNFANVLFLDAPAGTGYSYSANLDYTNNDDRQGIIGDHAYVDTTTAVNGMYRLGYARGLIPEELWKEIVDLCCDDICVDACDLFTVESQGCVQKRNEAPLCENDTDIETYMNLPEVCQALHVPRNNCGDWEADDAHSDDWYEDSLTATQAVLQALRFHVRVLLYYGDNALLSSIVGGRRWAYGQGLEGNQLIDGDDPPRPLTAQELDKLSKYDRDAGKYEQWESQYVKAPQFYYTGAYGTKPPQPQAPCLCESCKDYPLAHMPNYLDDGQ